MSALLDVRRLRSVDARSRRSTAPLATALAVSAQILAVIVLTAGIGAPAAMAADNEHDDAHRDRPHDHDAREDRRAGNDHRERDNDRRDHDERRRYEQQHYWRYQHPVYAPAPIYYPPTASPGITLVLPLEYRNR